MWGGFDRRRKRLNLCTLVCKSSWCASRNSTHRPAKIGPNSKNTWGQTDPSWPNFGQSRLDLDRCWPDFGQICSSSANLLGRVLPTSANVSSMPANFGLISAPELARVTSDKHGTNRANSCQIRLKFGSIWPESGQILLKLSQISPFRSNSVQICGNKATFGLIRAMLV